MQLSERRAVACHAREPKVAQTKRVGRGAVQNVSRFDVAVHHAARVQVAKGAQKVNAARVCDVGCHASGSQQTPKVPVIPVDDYVPLEMDVLTRVHSHNVRMPHLGEHREFSPCRKLRLAVFGITHLNTDFGAAIDFVHITVRSATNDLIMKYVHIVDRLCSTLSFFYPSTLWRIGWRIARFVGRRVHRVCFSIYGHLPRNIQHFYQCEGRLSHTKKFFFVAKLLIL
jgi:hypothetical protein